MRSFGLGEVISEVRSRIIATKVPAVGIDAFKNTRCPCTYLFSILVCKLAITYQIHLNEIKSVYSSCGIIYCSVFYVFYFVRIDGSVFCRNLP